MRGVEINGLAGLVAAHDDAVRIVELVAESHRALKAAGMADSDGRGACFFHLYCKRAEEVAVLRKRLGSTLLGQNLTLLKAAKAPTDIPVLSSTISDRAGELAHEWALRLGQLWLRDLWKRVRVFSAVPAVNKIRLSKQKSGWSSPSVWREIADVLSEKSTARLDRKAAAMPESYDLLARTLEGIPEGIVEILRDEFAAAVKLLGHGDGSWMHADSPGDAQCGEQQSLLAAPLSHNGAQQAEVEQGCDEGAEGAVQQPERLPAPVVDRRRKLKFERIPQLVQVFGTRKGLLERWKKFSEQPRTNGQAIGYREFAEAFGCEASEQHLSRLIDSEIRFQRRNGCYSR